LPLVKLPAFLSLAFQVLFKDFSYLCTGTAKLHPMLKNLNLLNEFNIKTEQKYCLGLGGTEGPK
jgi:hypothetical protein